MNLLLIRPIKNATIPQKINIELEPKYVSKTEDKNNAKEIPKGIPQTADAKQLAISFFPGIIMILWITSTNEMPAKHMLIIKNTAFDIIAIELTVCTISRPVNLLIV